MKISAIRVYQVDLPLVEGGYSWSEGKYVEVFNSTVVEFLTDDGNSGFGEVCPLGPFYLPAFGAGAGAGARAGVGELATTLIGQDPTAIGPINHLPASRCIGRSVSGPPMKWLKMLPDTVRMATQSSNSRSVVDRARTSIESMPPRTY